MRVQSSSLWGALKLGLASLATMGMSGHSSIAMGAEKAARCATLGLAFVGALAVAPVIFCSHQKA
jgi:hypothetical protein